MLVAINVQSRFVLLTEFHWVMAEPLVVDPWLFNTNPLASFWIWNVPAKLLVLEELTVRLMGVVCVKLPLVPVTVTVAVPVAAVLLALSVRVLVLVVLEGLNEAVTPLGNPEAERLTLPLKPLMGLTVIVLVPLLP